MSRVVTVAISDTALARAQEVAERTTRRLEDVLAEWINAAAWEPPVETLPDTEVRALCRSQMDRREQQELQALLVRQREGTLDATGREHLDWLMEVYRRGLVRKAQAFRVAVSRGLVSPLG